MTPSTIGTCLRYASTRDVSPTEPLEAPAAPETAVRKTPKSWNISVLQRQTNRREQTSIEHPTSMFQPFGRLH